MQVLKSTRLVLNRSVYSLLNTSASFSSSSSSSQFYCPVNRTTTIKTCQLGNSNFIQQTKQFSTFGYLMSQSKKPSQLSDELKAIMAKKLPVDENDDTGASKQKQTPEAETNKGEQKQSKMGMMFSREHGWKLTLVFFSALIGGSLFYVLIEWGAPKRDENNQPVKFKCCFG